MMSVYKFKSLKNLIAIQSKVQNLSYRDVAEGAGIHASYFSRVMTDKASFSHDQIFRICEKLGIEGEELQFALTLGALEQAVSPREKDFYRARIKQFQEEKLKVSTQLKSHLVSAEEGPRDFERYYQDALTGDVHMHLTLDEYRENPDLIARDLKVSPRRVQLELDKLESLGLIKRARGKVVDVLSDMHLDEASPASFRNHINWRLKTIQNLEERNPAVGDYHFSVAFSADEETKNDLRQLIRDFVVAAKKKVGACEKPRKVYHLMVDLY